MPSDPALGAASGAASTTNARTLRLARQSGLYAVGNGIAKASGVLLALIQLNTAYLPFVHFGRIDTALSLVLILVPLLGLGIPAGLLKFSTDGEVDERARAALSFTALVTVAASAGGAFVLAWPFAGWIGREVILSGVFDPVLTPHAALLARLVLAYAALKAVSGISLTRLQVGERALVYSLVTAGEMAVLIGLNYWFLVERGMGLRGVLWALVLSSALSALVLVGGLLARAPRVFRRDVVVRLVRYGAPLVVVVLSLPLLQQGDRFLLGRMAPPGELSLYGAAGRIAGIVNVILVQAFQTAFSVAGLKTLGAGEGASLHRRVFRHLCVVGGGFVLGLSLFAFDALALLTPKGSVYLDATGLVFPLALGFFFYALYVVGVNALYARGRTRRVTAGVLVAVGVNALLNVALIPSMGAMGAALATVIAYGALAVAAARATERIERVRFPWAALAGILVLITILNALGGLVNEQGLLVRLAARGGLMAAYPLGVLALRVYTWSDVVDGWHALRARVAHRLARAPRA